MKTTLVVVTLAFFACIAAAMSETPREGHIQVGSAALYFREVGRQQPMIVLHGGPDFDHRYFLPDLDRLSDAYRLIYYDQRGRGQSAAGVRPEDVSLASEITDLDAVRQYFRLDSTAILGHSWGALLALEYALRYPERVSRLILMNPAPVSAKDFAAFREYRQQRGVDQERLQAVSATDAFKAGDPDTVASYYRIFFKPALRRPEDLDKVMASLRAGFTKEGILEARAVEERLVKETWLADGYDLMPRLGRVTIPTLVIYSDHDFIPLSAAEHIAHAMPHARLATMKACGHFSYLECPVAVRHEIDRFFLAKRR